MRSTKIHFDPKGSRSGWTTLNTYCGRSLVFSTNQPDSITCRQCLKIYDAEQAKIQAEAQRIANLTAQAVIYHPETDEPAPKGQEWVWNARFGGYQLQSIGTPWASSVQSEAYWCS